ncbi:MAG: hypothetical protein IIX00_05000, partial [Tidjanibacter sp.]|nr:hypothetical protein [Tidjanibacter sp.]
MIIAGSLCAIQSCKSREFFIFEGFTVPEGRNKPWGTEHAIWCCKDVLDGPFAVINADDYYGQGA